MAGPIRVLHVEDDPRFAELTADVIERTAEDVQVTTVPDGETALERLDEEVDCVVSDYDMPTMDGLELLRRIRDRRPALPYILLTGKGSEAVAGEAISAGVDDYVRKADGPEQFEVLANRIENLVAQSRAETSYREVFEKATVGLTVHDPDEEGFVDVNRRYCELLGYTREEALELTLADVSAGVDGYPAERARERVRQAREEGRQTFEWLDETKDGEHVWVEVSLDLAEIEGEKRVLASVRDVTERRERERELRRQNERLEEVAAILGHDLRNPLQVASTGVELALETGDLDALEGVVTAHERIERLLEDVLAMARLGGEIDADAPVRLADAARECWASVGAGDAELAVETDAAVEADPARLERLLENLFHNAVEHAGPDVRVEVGDLDGAGFYVADDGPGVPPDERERVFEPGVSTADGTGLGLALVEDIAAAHGWAVRLAGSEAGGARFEVVTDGARHGDRRPRSDGEE